MLMTRRRALQVYKSTGTGIPDSTALLDLWAGIYICTYMCRNTWLYLTTPKYSPKQVQFQKYLQVTEFIFSCRICPYLPNQAQNQLFKVNRTLFVQQLKLRTSPISHSTCSPHCYTSRVTTWWSPWKISTQNISCPVWKMPQDHRSSTSFIG